MELEVTYGLKQKVSAVVPSVSCPVLDFMLP